MNKAEIRREEERRRNSEELLRKISKTFQDLPGADYLPRNLELSKYDTSILRDAMTPAVIFGHKVIFKRNSSLPDPNPDDYDTTLTHFERY